MLKNMVKRNNRNIAIDTARWIFAFLVVVIHIPLWRGDLLLPIARSAVPFFFIIAGFYLKDSDKALLNNAKKWGGTIYCLP